MRAFRKYGQLERLRFSREARSSLFPLSPIMWQEWAKDEACLNTSSEAVAAIERLYERGVHEYLSVPLWSEYLNFIQERDETVSQCKTEGIEKIRALFERALTAGGLHVKEGGKLWAAYREFEQALLLTMDESDDEVKAKQVDRIRNLFRRQLSVPLADMSETLEDYKVWEEQQRNMFGNDTDHLAGIPSNVISAYKKAFQMYSARAGYEEKLFGVKHAHAERLQHYLYLDLFLTRADGLRRRIMALDETSQRSYLEVLRETFQVTPRLTELRLFQRQQEAKSQGLVELSRAARKDETYTQTTDDALKISNKQSSTSQAERKRKTSIEYSDGNVQPKRQKGTRGKVPSTEVLEEQRESQLSKVDNAETDTLSGELIPGTSEQQTEETKNLKSSKQPIYTDQCTAFISNLGFEANEEHIRQFFIDCGGIKAIRLLRDRFSGKSRGLAYVEFDNEQYLAAAVAKNKQKLRGQKISVARSNPKESQRGVSARGGVARGRGGWTIRGSGAKTEETRQSLAESAPAIVSHRRGGHVKLTGSNTFAMPRNVTRPLGWGTKDGRSTETEETPKSNEEFRKMLLKS